MELSSDIIEIHDSPGIGSFLDLRTVNLKQIRGLGPPDLLYVVWEIKQTGIRKFLSKPINRGLFHFVYGLNMSSTTNIVDYLKSYMSSKLKNKGKVLVAYFCAFDLFSKFDLRVEINQNFELKYYLVNSNNNRIQAGNVHWQGVHVSSVLRYFYAEPVIGARLLDGPSQPLQFQSFIESAMTFWDRLGFVLGDLNDKIRYGENLLFSISSKFLLRRKRFQTHAAIFKKLSATDPLMLNYLGKAYIMTGKYQEVIDSTTSQLSVSPYSFSLYYTQALAYYHLKDYPQARRICQYLIELNLETFCFWELLTWCYLKEKKYASVLLTLNCFPAYESLNDDTKYDFREEDVIIPPKIPMSCVGNIWVKPEIHDFRPFQERAKSKKDQDTLKKLLALPSNKLSHCGRRMFSIIASMEKEMEWENLQKLKNNLFIQNQEKNEDEESKLNISQDYGLNDSQNQSIAKKRFSFYGSDSIAIDSQGQDIDESNEPRPDVTPRDYFFSTPTDHRLSHLMHPSFRCIARNLDDLFKCLVNDLKAIYDWQKQATEIDLKQDLNKNVKVPFGGEIWVRRGALAERLKRPKLAEKAYRYAVDSGFSMFAWHRLMKIYVRSGNPKAVLVCMVEVLKQLGESEYEIDMRNLPPWMEVVLAEMCSECGFKQLHSIAVELNASTFPCLMASIDALRLWKADGTTNRV
ncbi:BUD7_1 [Blepharisma stoltei]|uniref:Uncharacterized protein n=1 Tax=Blepharisma stoltei TaxID=1481888 RepID=A0AAU9K8E8_9CILI|nr:unnamed protein product [Blepharisma stoltei]